MMFWDCKSPTRHVVFRHSPTRGIMNCHFGQSKVKVQFTIAVRISRVPDSHHQPEALEEFLLYFTEPMD